MQGRIRAVWILAAVAAVVLLYGARAAVRARRDLVTLDVREMDVRTVVRKIEWQTWERVFVSKDVQGKVTLNIRNAPLEAALNLVAGQVSARSSHLYPIYRSKRSLRELEKLVQQGGNEMTEAQRWTNYSAGGRMGFGGPRGGFGPGEPDTNTLVNLSFQGREPYLAAITLGAATRALVIPEDGIPLKVNLELKNAAPRQAVKQFASALHRNYAEFYVMRAARPMEGRPPGEVDPEAMRARMEARMGALTAEQRARMEEMRNLSPEERRAVMQARMEDPAVQQRMIDRMLNDLRTSTPEQMVQRKRERRQMMQAFQQQGQGNPPGPRVQ